MTRHAIYEVFDQQKSDLLIHVLENQSEVMPVLVILRTRESVHALAADLAQLGLAVDSIHGKKKPELIERALGELRSGKLGVVVTTDASARNLDLGGIRRMVQVDFPEIEADYLSRLKVVEAAEDGVLWSFENPHNVAKVEEVEAALGYAIERERAEGFEYEAQALRARPVRHKTPKRGPRSKPLQHKKKKWKPKKYGRN